LNTGIPTLTVGMASSDWVGCVGIANLDPLATDDRAPPLMAMTEGVSTSA
jgi:hypothetical protein